MDLALELTALKSKSRELPVNERARLSWDLSQRFGRVGVYERAYEALAEFWPDRTQSPRLFGLDESTKAEILLRSGALAGRFCDVDQIEGRLETAKNLITKSIDIFETLKQLNKV